MLRFMDSSVSKGATVSAFVIPRDSTNFLTASGLIPLRLRPPRVGILGSSYPVMRPSSISGFITLFDVGIPSKASLEK